MVKGKSSASSGTRKKHAKKAAAASSLPDEPTVPKEKKLKGKDKRNKEPKKKVYIPPVKPAPVQPDPLDTLGIAQRLPPELLIALRRLAKKDSITKRRALEELQAAWVDKARGENSDSIVLSYLADAVPVWLHHVPALFLHPSRRIRLLAVGLHLSLLRLQNTVTDQLFYFLREVATSDQAEYIIGAWCLAAHDIDRPVAAIARESWTHSVAFSPGSKIALDRTLLSSLWEFVQRTALDPNGIYLYVNPPQPVAAPPLSQKKSARPPPGRKEEETNTRTKTEEDEEDEQDRWARLRIGALGSAEWLLSKQSESTLADRIGEHLALFSNHALWSALYHGHTPPFVPVDSFGHSQPGVRKAAWSLIQTIVKTCKAHLNVLLPVLSRAILRSAWVEPDSIVRGSMWQPLLMFLKEFPNAWEIEATSDNEIEEEDSDDEDEDEDRISHVRIATGHSPSSGPTQAYLEFLQFLQLGCSGSPLQGYPAVLVIISTIPSKILGTLPFTDFFTSFWAALDGRALSSLDRNAASAAFLSSLLECIVFLARRVLKTVPEGEPQLLSHPTAEGTDGADLNVHMDIVRTLVNEQVAHVWDELISRRLKVNDETASSLIMRSLTLLYQLESKLFEGAWAALMSGIRDKATGEDVTMPPLVPVLLKACQDHFEPGSQPAILAKAVIGEVVKAAVQQCEGVLDIEQPFASERISGLVAILDRFGSSLFRDPGVAKVIDGAMRMHTKQLLSISPRLLLLYFWNRQDTALCLKLWQEVLRAITIRASEVGTTLVALLDAADQKLLPSYLIPRDADLDDLAADILADASSKPQQAAEVNIIRRLLRSPEHFISQGCHENLVKGVCSGFAARVPDALYNESFPLDILEVRLDLIEMLFEHQPLYLMSPSISLSVLPEMFFFAYFLPEIRSIDDRPLATARRLWETWMGKLSQRTQTTIQLTLRQRLDLLVLDCSAYPTPEQIIRVVSRKYTCFDVDTLAVLPSKRSLDIMLDELPSHPSDACLAVLDPLVPPSSLYEQSPPPPQPHCRLGLSSYARAIHALLLYFSEERHAAKENAWTLRHFLVLSLYAEELIRIPTSRSPLFAHYIQKPVLVDIVTKVQQMTAYLLSSAQDEAWHAAVVSAISADKADSSPDDVGRLIFDLISLGKKNDTIRESRVLHIILQHTLSGASKSESEQWLRLVRKLEKPAPHMALAIIYSVTRYAPEPPLMDRYRNELAAGLLGVPAYKANKDGLWLLLRLTASAPDPESDVVFLPQLRAVNLMKICQQWVASDEDLDEEVESEMTHVFLHLAPILQNVPGAHWDFIFDVMENNLENSSLSDSSTFVTLSRTLRLYIAIEDLASTNKALRAAWQPRETACMTRIRDLATIQLDSGDASEPLSVCRELVLQIVQDLPDTLMNETTLAKMCHIITDSSLDVQKMAYQFLHEAARKYTENMVIEAAVESEVPMTPKLPIELVHILQRNLNFDDPLELASQNPSSYFLVWMLLFDLFSNASLKVKSGYTDQLRDLGLVSEHLLPNLFSALGLYEGILKAFKLDIWDIESFYLDSYSADSGMSLRLLAAHVYYRALLTVPSLVRGWLSECRDRQLSGAVTAYTANHFSPMIIKTELTQVKSPVATVELLDENVTIKVASAINAVTASYAVDEYQLELTVKLPSDYPLHGIEMHDKRVGVPEDRWRAWVLGVQQILLFRSGSIADGLSFFKKNVSSHFEGLAACAICYSIISATDSSLPRKPCKTCKNRFHAGCLFKQPLLELPSVPVGLYLTARRSVVLITKL
ncbi:uncharacterized protein FIBRA_07316 [Fibroporia radiculosa]|uniref:E3 ubiquitin-protein ligase listerin n=1 Tax=Fibroporia radiculosa TaxID=599839 RepID=J4H4J7_9APHY|nr:uncharacterized protein FIBRA_07316 [Fibroporia radiculosa]CCM05109.1 predicted protein [Fibroporia radiculosa]